MARNIPDGTIVHATSGLAISTITGRVVGYNNLTDAYLVIDDVSGKMSAYPSTHVTVALQVPKFATREEADAWLEQHST